MVKLFVTGNRHLTTADTKYFVGELKKALLSEGLTFKDVTQITRGASTGAEVIMHKAADALGIPVKQILPSEDNWGKKARLVANWDIMPEVDLAIVFEDKDDDFVQKTKEVLIKSGKKFIVIE